VVLRNKKRAKARFLPSMKVLSVDRKSYQFISITIRKKSLSNVHRQKRFSNLPK